MSGPVYLLEITPPAGVSASVIRLATQSLSTAPSDTPANTKYLGDIEDLGKLERSVAFGVGGSATARYLPFRINNGTGKYDTWFDLGLDGWSFVLKMIGAAGAQVSSAEIVQTGIIAGIDPSDSLNAIGLSIVDRLAALDVPLLTARYAGTTTEAGATAEGDGELAGQVKPYAFGSPANVLPKLVNRFNLLYQVAANGCSSIVAYDGAVALTYAGDFGTLDALNNALLVGGQYATCLAQGIFRLGGLPFFAVTADVIEGASLSLRSAARVAQRIFALTAFAGDVQAASFDALHALMPAEVGIVIDDDATIRTVVGNVLDSNAASLVTTIAGQYRAVAIRPPALIAADTFELRNIDEDGATFSPLAAPTRDGEGASRAWSVIVNHARVWHTMSASDVAGSVTSDRMTFLANEFRASTPAQDAAVKLAHPRAVEIVKSTLLTTKADADAFAALLLAMYKVRRDAATILPMPLARARARDIGDTVAVRVKRLGYDLGRNMLIVGRTDDHTNQAVAHNLWG